MALFPPSTTLSVRRPGDSSDAVVLRPNGRTGSNNETSSTLISANRPLLEDDSATTSILFSVDWLVIVCTAEPTLVAIVVPFTLSVLPSSPPTTILIELLTGILFPSKVSKSYMILLFVPLGPSASVEVSPSKINDGLSVDASPKS